MKLLVLALCSVAVAQSETGWPHVRSVFHREVEKAGIVGASMVVVQGSRIVASTYHGYADLATKRRVNADTIYHWASITKTLTGIAIMQLRDRGRLSLEDPIVKYVPELRRIHDPNGDVERITLRHLLSHSSGFRNSTWPWGGDEDWHPHEPASWDQLVAMLPYTKLLFRPGERYSYSNPAYCFLGQVIERLTGEDWEVYVEKNVLRPLALHRSYFDLTPHHLIGDRANNYWIEGGSPVANGLDFDTGITVSNGGWNAPITDLAAYLGFLLGRGDTGRYDGVLKRSTLEEMWRPAVRVGGGSGAERSVALSYFVERRGDLTVIGHTGSQKAFLSFFLIEPRSGVGVVTAYNSDGRGPDSVNTRAVYGRIRTTVLEELVAGRLLKGAPDESAIVFRRHGVVSAQRRLWLRERTTRAAAKAADGNAVLLLHGATWSSEPGFDLDVPDYSTMDYLAGEGFDVFALDLAGYGESDDPKGWYGAAEAVADVDAAIAHLRKIRGIDRVHLLGWSWGAQVAGRYAANHPDRVDRLILYGFQWGDDAERRDPPAEAFGANTVAMAKSDFIDGCYDAHVVARFVETCLQVDPKSPRGSYRDYRQNRPLVDPTAVAAPCLMLFGEHEPRRGDTFRFFSRLGGSDKQLAIVPGGGHAVHLERGRHRWRDEVVGFLRQR